MVWEGGGGYTLAPTLITLFDQLEVLYPDHVWDVNPQTGTIGDASHRAEGNASDHNPWFDDTVRALDVANGDPHGPDCEALFDMVNKMYGAEDPRVYPNGYAIYLNRITSWSEPGRYRATTPDEDPHLHHVHISVSTNLAGIRDTRPWPYGVARPDNTTATPLIESAGEDMIIFRDPRDGKIYRDSESIRKPKWIAHTADVAGYLGAGYKKAVLTADEAKSRLGK